MSEFTTPEPWPTALGDTGVTLYCSGPLMRKIKVIRNFFIATERDVAGDKVKLAILQSAGGVYMDVMFHLQVKMRNKVRLKKLIQTPQYGINRQNADYFNSSLHLRNLNIIDPSGVVSYIFVYDERSGGKDGNSVCSVRWEALILKQR